MKATRQTALAGRRHWVRTWRARSVSTRVFPDPAGAMTRDAPPGWVTAASWSSARSAIDRLDPKGVNEPCSTEIRCTTAVPSIGSVKRTGPPSIHTSVPSGSTTSPSADCGGAVAPRPIAVSVGCQVRWSGSRPSTEFDHSR